MTRIATQSTIRIGHSSQRPPPPLHGDLAAGVPRPAEAGDASPYSGDSVPLSRLATPPLRTITPLPAPLSDQPGTGGLPCRSRGPLWRKESLLVWRLIRTNH